MRWWVSSSPSPSCLKYLQFCPRNGKGGRSWLSTDEATRETRCCTSQGLQPPKGSRGHGGENAWSVEPIKHGTSNDCTFSRCLCNTKLWKLWKPCIFRYVHRAPLVDVLPRSACAYIHMHIQAMHIYRIFILMVNNQLIISFTAMKT